MGTPTDRDASLHAATDTKRFRTLAICNYFTSFTLTVGDASTSLDRSKIRPSILKLRQLVVQLGDLFVKQRISTPDWSGR